MSDARETTGPFEDEIMASLFVHAEQTRLPHEPTHDEEAALRRFDAWLHDNVEETETTANTADHDLQAELAYDGFQGPKWDMFAHRLAEYGLAVIKAWLKTGEMWNQCKKRNCWPGPPPASLSEDDRAELANETVARAIKTFRDRAMVQGGWKLKGGASLRTYYIGTCVYAFPNVYRKWRREQVSELKSIGIESDLPVTAWQDAIEIGIEDIPLKEGLNNISDETTRQAILLQVAGYHIDEIAELLQTAAKAVERILARQRRRVLASKPTEASAMNDDSGIDDLIEQFSLGTSGARRLCRRTSRDEVRAVLQRSNC
jgi:DNA-directed RNA polymerase specialized sigma24 family protein